MMTKAYSGDGSVRTFTPNRCKSLLNSSPHSGVNASSKKLPLYLSMPKRTLTLSRWFWMPLVRADDEGQFWGSKTTK